MSYTANDTLVWWSSQLQSGEVIFSAEEPIKKIVAEKNLKAKKYRNDYNQKWLLIYADD
ncbi:hypothetical protein [Hydrotalea flava]|uniref:hypothetical protein n=1 Tax=Hydrotalea flava TaxID=714549 RepID=UPI00142EF15A|nr:hypothetical protein [Hydrotalea flava]